MTTIFTKEIERLEKEIEENSERLNVAIVRFLKSKLQTLKQAEQKHLKFVEELKEECWNKEKELSNNLIGNSFNNGFSSACDWIRTEVINNLSKGDGK